MEVFSDRTMGRLFLLLFLVHQSSAVIYHLNFTEYSKMPDLYALDDYDKCMVDVGGTFCVLDATLSAKGDSELMNMIQNYTAYSKKHYNHSMIHRAICVQRTCKDFIKNRKLEGDDLLAVLNECVDDSMWKEYNLNARVIDINYCKRQSDVRTIGAGDYVMVIVYLVLIGVNAAGTAYDLLKGKNAKNPYLMSFSIRRNWGKLIAPSGVGPDPRLNKLQTFNGMRAMTMICVFFSHTALVMAHHYIRNPYYIETAYDDPGKFILFNGTLVTFTFFVMSGFLLAFNFEIHAEKHGVSLWEWPKGMLMRWLRLTPTYALVLFTVMTIMRHLGDGPLWEHTVVFESTACHQYWWAHLLYINNYIYDDSQCFPQSWYLAADTQLFGLGLLFCILFRRRRPQVIGLVVLMVLSILIPAAHTYFDNLDALVIQSPEIYRSIYQNDDGFRLVFVRGHTNLSTYTLGIAGGLLAYHWLKNEEAVAARLKKYRLVFWGVFPLGVGTILTGAIFYVDGYEASTVIKVLYAAIYKPVFQLLVLVVMFGCIFKVEDVYRGILEWRGFTWMGRCSYSGFLVHSMIQRGLYGSQRVMVYMTDFYVMAILATTIFMGFGLGALLFISVESPLAQITKAILMPPRKPRPNTEEASATTKV